MSKMLDLLLRPEAPNVAKNLPTAQYKHKRLSKLCGEDVIFTLRALPYGRVTELKESGGADICMDILLAGVIDPNLKDSRLAEKFGGVTPAETVKAMLLPGEMEGSVIREEADIARLAEEFVYQAQRASLLAAP